MKRWAVILPPLVPAAAVLIVTEVAVRAAWVPRFILPAPSDVAYSLVTDAGELWKAAGWTAAASLIGFVTSAIVGVMVAVLLSSAVWVRRALYPYAVFFQTVPLVAVAPLLVIYIGTGIETVIVSSFVVSVFPVVASTLTGLLSTEPALRDLFKLHQAKPWATLWKLRLPSALPGLLTGLRVAAGLSVIGAVVGEFIVGGGLGSRVSIAIQQQDTARIFAVLLLLTCLGLGLFGLVNALTFLLLRRWHASQWSDE